MITRSNVHKTKLPGTYFNVIVIDSFDTDNTVPRLYLKLTFNRRMWDTRAFHELMQMATLPEYVVVFHSVFQSRNTSKRSDIENE